MRHLIFSGVAALLFTGCANNSAQAPEPAANFANFDRGESLGLTAGGRGAYSTWHAGPERTEQAACVEPPAEAGSAGWRRFEICMEWFNGLIDREAYRARLGEASGE